MALVFRRKNSKCWYARWQLDGRDHVVSTGKRDKKAAQEELKRLVAEAKGQTTIQEQLERLLQLVAALPAKDQVVKRQELVRDILAGQERKLPMADGWEKWRVNSNREYEPKKATLDGYEAIWKRFQKWAESKRIPHLHELSREHAEEYGSNLWHSKVSPTTFNAHIKFLRGAFAVLETQAGLVGNVWSHIKHKQKNGNEGRRNLTEEELKTVLLKAKGNLGVMIHIGLFSGLRLGDVVNLRWSDIDFERGFITVMPLKTRRFGKKLEIPIHSALSRTLTEFKKETGSQNIDFLFPAERADYQDNVGNLTIQFQELFKECGIQTTEAPDHGHRRRAIIRVGFHSLRHSFVSLCAKARTPQHVVQQLVGHGSPAMTEHYTHLDPQQKTDAINSLPEFCVGKQSGSPG